MGPPDTPPRSIAAANREPWEPDWCRFGAFFGMFELESGRLSGNTLPHRRGGYPPITFEEIRTADWEEAVC